MALIVEKTQMIKNDFPEYFAANKELLFRDLLKNYNDDAGRYELPKTMDFTQEKGLELAGLNAKKGEGGAGGIVGDITGTDSNNSLAATMSQ